MISSEDLFNSLGRLRVYLKNLWTVEGKSLNV